MSERLDYCRVPRLGDKKAVVRLRDERAAGPAGTAEQISREEGTVMVVGHFRSTSTREALPIYLQERNRIPVILTTETNPDLVPASDNDAFAPVLRLWPTDDKQARDAAKHAARRGDVFWVVEDTSDNYVYSHYLARHFVESILETDGKRVVLWTNNHSLPSPETLSRYGIDIVFFPGGWRNALVLVQAIEHSWESLEDADEEPPNIFLTDAAALRLMSQGALLPNRVFMTHPLPPPDVPIDDAEVFEAAVLQAYADLADDACKIVTRLLQDANLFLQSRGNWLLDFIGYQSVHDARLAVASAMDTLAERDLEEIDAGGVTYSFSKGDDGRYQTRHNGCEASFHVWRVVGSAVEDAVEDPCAE